MKRFALMETFGTGGHVVHICGAIFWLAQFGDTRVVIDVFRY